MFAFRSHQGTTVKGTFQLPRVTQLLLATTMKNFFKCVLYDNILGPWMWKENHPTAVVLLLGETNFQFAAFT